MVIFHSYVKLPEGIPLVVWMVLDAGCGFVCGSWRFSFRRFWRFLLMVNDGD
jgi:hypothetical protein